jgi:CBS domain-containing protein
VADLVVTVIAMRLGELVEGTAHVCGPDTTLREAAAAMSRAGHGSLGVVEGGTLIGLLTERDLVSSMAGEVDPESPVRAIMTPDPDVFAPTVDAVEAGMWLVESEYRHLPVVESGRVLGVVSVADVLGAVLATPGIVEGEEE